MLVEAGTTSLTANNTYSGNTTVNGGTLLVNGSIANSNTTVNAGGTLGGTGIVGNTTINGGTLAPGNSIGTLTVQGNLVFTAASTYMVEVDRQPAPDRTNVTGTATLGGATVSANFATGSYVAKRYTILNATGGVSGTFNALVNTNLPANFTSIAELRCQQRLSRPDADWRCTRPQRRLNQQPAERRQRADQLVQHHRRHPRWRSAR